MAVKTVASSERIADSLLRRPEFSNLDREQAVLAVEWAQRKIADGKTEEFFLSCIKRAEENNDGDKIMGGKLALEAFRIIGGETQENAEVSGIIRSIEPVTDKPTDAEILGVKPIHIWLDSGVEEKYAKEVYNALEYLVKVGNGRLDELTFVVRESSVADDCVQKAFVAKDGKVNAITLSNKASEAVFNEGGHVQLFITSKNLYAPGMGANNFVFGVATGSGIYQSYNRMKEWYGGEMIYDPLTGKMGDAGPITFRMLLIHELSHFWDAPNRERDGIQMMLGPHCPRTDCVLGQINMKGRPSLIDETKGAVERMRKHGGGYLCSDCENDVKNGQEEFYGNAEYEFWRSPAYLAEIGRFEDALGAYEKMDALGMDDFLGKGRVLEALGRQEEAEKCYEIAYGMLCESGRLQISENEPEYAQAGLDRFSRALEIFPDGIDAVYGKAKALYLLGDNEGALACIGRVLETNPEDATAWQNKGIVLMELGREAEAQKCFDKAKALGLNE